MPTNFKPMLAHSKTPDLKTLRYPQMIQPKLDGVRAVVKDGKVLSRTLKLIPNLEIQAALGRPEFEGLDGELIVGDPRDDAAYRNTTTFVMAENKTGAPWTYFVFDLWDHPGTNIARYNTLREMSTNGGLAAENIQIVATAVCPDQEALELIESTFLGEGYEGAILRAPDARYKFGRAGKTGPLLKLKRYIDFEAKVVGVYEEMHNTNVPVKNALGRTERSTMKAGLVGKGTLGGLILVALNGPAEGVEFRCGTGFDAAQRADLWARHFAPGGKTTLHGQVAKVKSFPIGVKDKPRHPVWLGWRDMEIDG